MPQKSLPAERPAWVESGRCQLVGQRVRDLADLTARRDGMGVSFGLQAEAGPASLTDYYFYLGALLFDFRGFDVTMGGTSLSGADAFFTLAGRQAARDATFFSAERLLTIEAETVQIVFSVSGRPEDCALRRCDERAALLRDSAARLQHDFGGSAGRLLDATQGYLRRPDGRGLMDLLGTFAGYQDPHFKKGFVLVKALEAQGLWRPVDREHLYVPVDYHLMRVALRSGMVETMPALGAALRGRVPATDELDTALRDVVKLAYKEVERAAALDIFALDELFWTLGRSCCHYARPPRCHSCDYSHCTVMRSFAYQCPGQCPLSGVCRGSQEPAFADLYETSITTVFY